MRPSPRVVGALCAAAMAVAACTSSAADPGEDVTSDAAVTESPSPTESRPSPSPSDPFAMPDPVTKEYVDRVVNTLYEEWGAITREILEQPADPAAINPVAVRERIAALFAGQYLRQRLNEADAMLRGEREGLLPPEEFDQLRIETRQVKKATPECLVVAGDYVTSGTSTEEGRIIAAFSLSPADSANDTGWKIIDVVRSLDAEGNRVPDDVMLEASVEELRNVLNTSCTSEAGSQ